MLRTPTVVVGVRVELGRGSLVVVDAGFDEVPQTLKLPGVELAQVDHRVDVDAVLGTSAVVVAVLTDEDRASDPTVHREPAQLLARHVLARDSAPYLDSAVDHLAGVPVVGPNKSRAKAEDLFAEIGDGLLGLDGVGVHHVSYSQAPNLGAVYVVE